MTPFVVALVALMHALEPYEPVARLAPLAEAIERATPVREERAVLVVVSMYETTFGRAGVPFGLTCCYQGLYRKFGRSPTLTEYAQRLLAIWHLAATPSQCGSNASVLRRFGYFHSGRCDLHARNHATNVYEPDAYAHHEARTYRHVLARMP